MSKTWQWMDKPLRALNLRIGNLMETGDVYVVWFHDWSTDYFFPYSAPDLRELSILEPVAELADGVILKGDARPCQPFPSPFVSPAAPPGLTAVGGNGSIILSWGDLGDCAIRNYEFRLKWPSNIDWRPWRRLSGGRLPTVRRILYGLTSGVEYRIQLRAVNDVGPGEASETSATPTSSTGVEGT